MTRTQINDFDMVEVGRYQGDLSIPYIEEPTPRYIKDVLIEYNRRGIILQPEFQRQFVWSKTKQKELIKSLYAGFPLPMFYFAETGNGKYEVVDGQQRLTTILGFLNPDSIDKHIRSKLISNIRINHNGDRINLRAGEGHIPISFLNTPPLFLKYHQNFRRHLPPTPSLPRRD